MQAVNGASLAGFQNSQASVRFQAPAQPVRATEQAEHAEKAEKPEKAGHESRVKDDLRSDHGPERATQIFRQEISQSLKIAFSSAFSLSLSSSNPYKSSESPADLATDVAVAARTIVEESPEEPTKTLVRVRQSVEQAISTSQQIVNTDEGATALEAADGLIKRGLDALASDPRLTSASAFSVESTSKQRSTIQIRTQEGDIIKFDLRRVDKLSASDVSLQTESGRATSTEVSISSKSRLVLKVDGDLNSAELEAIKNVFAQAEQLAQEFFSGDLNAALEVVAGLEFDSSQLAKVSMKFRSNERISAQQTVLQSAPATAAPVEARIAPLPAPTPTPTPVAASSILPPAADENAVVTATPEVRAEAAGVPGTGGLLSGFSALADFLGKIADFLEQSVDQFDGGFPQGSMDVKIRFDFTESFRLDILKAVMLEVAPEHEESDDADGTLQQAS